MPSCFMYLLYCQQLWGALIVPLFWFLGTLCLLYIGTLASVTGPRRLPTRASSFDYSCYICPILSYWGTVVFFSFPVCSAGPFPLFPPPRVWRTSAPRPAPGRPLTLALLLSLVTCHILDQTSDLQAELVHRIYKLSSPSLDCLEPWNQQ